MHKIKFMEKDQTKKVAKKTIIRKQIYSVEIVEYSDGSCAMNRTNDGFNTIELIGILELTQSDIRKQMMGVIKPDVIKRTAIVD